MRNRCGVLKYLATMAVIMTMLITASSTVLAAPEKLNDVELQNRSANFNKNYTITGNGAQDMANIALAQVGKTEADMGYTEAWCANFVSDCGRLANQSAAIPPAAGVGTLRNSITGAGGTFWYTGAQEPQVGDIVFKCTCSGSDCGSIGQHAGLVVEVTATSIVTVEGNMSNKVMRVVHDKAGNSKYYGYINGFARPKYTNNMDKTPPTISNVEIKNYGPSGYNIYVTVTDNVGVTKVQFPTWTAANGQDDIVWGNPWSVDGNVYNYRVNISDHNNEAGEYITDIYAYDAAGNCSTWRVTKSISKIEDVSMQFYALRNKKYNKYYEQGELKAYSGEKTQYLILNTSTYSDGRTSLLWGYYYYNSKGELKSDVAICSGGYVTKYGGGYIIGRNSYSCLTANADGTVTNGDITYDSSQIWYMEPLEVVSSISESYATIEPGETKQLKVTVSPVGFNTPTWKSSNENIATVSSTGLVTAVGEGTAIITADVYGDADATCEITVKKKGYTGVMQAQDGNYYLYENGKIISDYAGLYEDSKYGLCLIINGKMEVLYNGMYNDLNYGWAKIANGKVDTAYSDLYYDSRIGWGLLANGILNEAYDGLYCSPTLGWWKVKEGLIDFEYSDIFYDSKVGWWKVNNGQLDLGYTDLYYSPTIGWWKVNGGALDLGYTDLYCSPTLGWWKVNNGSIDFAYTDLYCSPTWGWWKVNNGQLDTGYTDLYCSQTLGWWKVNNGQLDLGYTDLYCSPTLGWWKVNNGQLDLGYTDFYFSPTIGWWKVKNGQLDLSYYGLYCSPTLGWWKVISGAIDFGFTGVYNDAAVGDWYINNGALDATFNGYVTTNGITYLVTGGHAVPVSYGAKPEEMKDSANPEIEPAKPVTEEQDETAEPVNPVIDGNDEPDTDPELLDA